MKVMKNSMRPPSRTRIKVPRPKMMLYRMAPEGTVTISFIKLMPSYVMMTVNTRHCYKYHQNVLTICFNKDDSDNESCRDRLQEDLMQSDVLVKLLLLLLSLHGILVDGVDQFCSL